MNSTVAIHWKVMVEFFMVNICVLKQAKTSFELSFAICKMRGVNLESLGVHPAESTP